MSSKFVVRKESLLQRSTGAECTHGPYPKSRSAVVKSTLKLYPPSDGVPQYSVLLEQTDETRSNTFVLYESDCRQDVSAQRDDARKHFEVIHKTLKPLIEDGVVMLSTYLLNLFDFEAELQDIKRDEGEDEETTPPKDLQDGIERDEDEDEETMPPEEDDTAAETKGARRVMEDGNGFIDKIWKKSTELEAAFEKNDCDYYRQLLKSGQSLSKPVDGSEDDSNYLHFAAERKEKKAHKMISSASNYIMQLVQKSSPASADGFLMALNATNKNGFTPLMLAVRKQHVESALALLLAGADPDIPDRDGDTPLHHAAQLGNLKLVRLLVVFFANLKDVDTLLKVASESNGKEASFCVEILEETKKAAANTLLGTLEPISLPDDPIFLLSLDGGSVKCVITIQLLLHLAKRMKEIQDGTQQGNGEPVRLQSYFDYMAGTSAGSFTALALRYCSNITLEICRANIFKVSEEVMSNGPTFCSVQTEQSLKETFGEDLTMTSSKSEKQRVIVTTVLADSDPPVLHLMCNYARPPPESPKERRKPIPSIPSEKEQEIAQSPNVKEILSGERKVWEAARASSAAPYYFDPFKKRLIDGGVMANNPTLDSLVEIFRQGEWERKTVNVRLVLSIGTGIPIARQLKHVGVYRPCGASSVMKSLMKAHDSFRGLVNLFNQLRSQSTRSDGQEVERANAWCKAMGAQYVRLSPELSKDYDFGETDSVTLTELMYEGHIYALEQREKIDHVARLLLKRVPINGPK